MTESTRTDTAPILESGSKDAVTVVKCRCGDPVCNRYGFSDGNFLMGAGWSKERAEQYAAAINSYSPERDALLAQLVTALKAVLVMAEVDQPRKLDEALTWRQNDEKARALADAALTEYERQKQLPK